MLVDPNIAAELKRELGGWDRASIVLQPVHLEQLDRVIAAGHSAGQVRQEMARALVLRAAGATTPDGAIRSP